MRWRTFLSTACLLAAAGLTLTAQPQPRRATTIAAIRAYPGFYHQQTVLVVGEVKGTLERATISDEGSSLTLIARELPREGRLEARGQLLDIGRVSQDDPRLIPFNLLDRIRTQYQDRWPKPGEELLLILGGTSPPPPTTNATSPPLRSVAMEPSRFDGQKITVTGQFRGRNLFGELPEEPTQGKYPFVLRSGDAALWIFNLQPKGKTFNFDPSKRIDTGRWVTVRGTVHSARGLTWLDGTSIDLAPTPQETTEVTIDLPPPPPVEILFIAPEEGEGDVKTTERIRVQFSRDLDPATLKDHIRFTPEVPFTTNYTKDNRALEIRPTGGLPPFTPMKLEFLEGIKGPDGGALKPLTLTFTTGS
jgi:hypothetical protein